MNKFSDQFVHPSAHYQRDVDVVNHYISDASQYLALSTGKPVAECRAFVIKNLKPDGQFAFKDPETIFLQREANGDRVKKSTTLSRYLRHSVANKELVAPTFTTYTHPSSNKSVLSSYVEMNLAKRSLAKKAMFAAEAAKDHSLAAIKKIEQTGRKLGNNAISGAHVSASTPLYNKTAHSTLTSTCRTTSAYGNANNEKFLSGNRHYFDRDVVINNIISIIGHVDYAAIEAVMAKYQLHYPSCEETMACIIYSTQFYWWNEAWLADIRALVDKLTPVQRAAFLYVGDAYHLLKHNEPFMRGFITRLSDKCARTHPDPMATLKAAPDNYLNLAHQICFEETSGIEPRQYTSIAGSEKLHCLASTVENIADTIYDHRDLIACFWMTSNLPASVAHFPSSIRRSALTSDTDSTIFTVQDWMIWYSGKPIFDARSRAVYASVVFLTSATITHVLATMSANFGIPEEHLFKIAMKSEFTFDVFIPSQLGKHYYACISCTEGMVHDELKYEIKGAQLKSANAPRAVIKDATEMMHAIINDVRAHGEVSIYHWLNHVGKVEANIISSIKEGHMGYFRTTSIKDGSSYAGKKEDSPFANHFMWQEVFAEKYGTMPEPPYSTYKLSVTTNTPTKLKRWLAGLPDQAFAKRMDAYLLKYEKTNITTFNLPAEILNARGTPEEVKEIIDYEKIVVDICRIYYILLETLGYYALGDQTKRLLSAEGWGTPQV